MDESFEEVFRYVLKERDNDPFNKALYDISIKLMNYGHEKGWVSEIGEILEDY
jgi:hypothetical protein